MDKYRLDDDEEDDFVFGKRPQGDSSPAKEEKKVEEMKPDDKPIETTFNQRKMKTFRGFVQNEENLEEDFLETPWRIPSVDIAKQYKRTQVFLGGEAYMDNINITKASELGVGVRMYFHFVKSFTVALIIMTILAIPTVLFSYYGSSMSTDEQDVGGLYKYTLGNFGKENDYFTGSSENIALYSNSTYMTFMGVSFEYYEANVIISGCDFLQIIVFLIVVWHLQNRMAQYTNNEEARDHVSITHYAVYVENIPFDTKEEELIEHFSGLYPLDKVDWRNRLPVEDARPVQNVDNSGEIKYLNSWIAEVFIYRKLGEFLISYDNNLHLLHNLYRSRSQMKLYKRDTSFFYGDSKRNFLKKENEMLRIAGKVDKFHERNYRRFEIYLKQLYPEREKQEKEKQKQLEIEAKKKAHEEKKKMKEEKKKAEKEKKEKEKKEAEDKKKKSPEGTDIEKGPPVEERELDPVQQRQYAARARRALRNRRLGEQQENDQAKEQEGKEGEEKDENIKDEGKEGASSQNKSSSSLNVSVLSAESSAFLKDDEDEQEKAEESPVKPVETIAEPKPLLDPRIEYSKSAPIVGAFICFEYNESFARCLEDYTFYNSFPFSLFYPKELLFKNRKLKITRALEPDQIKYEYLEYTWLQRKLLLLRTFLFTILMMIMTFVVLFMISHYKMAFQNIIPSNSVCNTVIPSLYLPQDIIVAASTATSNDLSKYVNQMSFVRPPSDTTHQYDTNCSRYVQDSFYLVYSMENSFNQPSRNYSYDACPFMFPPTSSPTFAPTFVPSEQPTLCPSGSPSEVPTFLPTMLPSSTSTSLEPTYLPSEYPTSYPTTPSQFVVGGHGVVQPLSTYEYDRSYYVQLLSGTSQEKKDYCPLYNQTYTCPCVTVNPIPSALQCSSLSCQVPGVKIGSSSTSSCSSIPAKDLGLCYCKDLVFSHLTTNDILSYFFNNMLTVQSSTTGTSSGSRQSGLFSVDSKYCSSFNGQFVLAYILTYASVVCTIGINLLLKALLIFLTPFEGHQSIDEEQTSILFKLFISMYFNMGIIILIANGLDFEFSSIPTITRGPYVDFTREWYGNIGFYIVSTLFLTVASSICLKYCMLHWYPRFRRFVYNYYIAKKKCTSKTIQSDVNDLQVGKRFMPTLHTAQLLSWLFYTMTYSTGVPLILPITAVGFFMVFRLDKHLLGHYYRKPYILDEVQMKHVLSWLPYAALIRIVVSIAMLSSDGVMPYVFPNTNGYNQAVSGGYNTNVISLANYQSLVNTVQSYYYDYLLAYIPQSAQFIFRRALRSNTFPFTCLFVLIAVILFFRYLWSLLPMKYIYRWYYKTVLLSKKKASIFDASRAKGYMHPFDLVLTTQDPLRREAAPYTGIYYQFVDKKQPPPPKNGKSFLAKVRKALHMFCLSYFDCFGILAQYTPISPEYFEGENDTGKKGGKDDALNSEELNEEFERAMTSTKNKVIGYLLKDGWEVTDMGFDFEVKVKRWTAQGLADDPLQRFAGQQKRTFEVIDDFRCNTFHLAFIHNYQYPYLALTNPNIRYHMVGGKPRVFSIVDDYIERKVKYDEHLLFDPKREEMNLLRHFQKFDSLFAARQKKVHPITDGEELKHDEDDADLELGLPKLKPLPENKKEGSKKSKARPKSNQSDGTEDSENDDDDSSSSENDSSDDDSSDDSDSSEEDSSEEDDEDSGSDEDDSEEEEEDTEEEESSEEEEEDEGSEEESGDEEGDEEEGSEKS